MPKLVNAGPAWLTERPLSDPPDAQALRDLWKTDIVIDHPAVTGTGAGTEPQRALAMQRTAISIIEMPPERTWTWFDQYVADRSILLVWNRPFRSSEEMNRHQLARWLDRVGTNDTILGLGDVGRLDAWRGPTWSSTYAPGPASGLISATTTAAGAEPSAAASDGVSGCGQRPRSLTRGRESHTPTHQCQRRGNRLRTGRTEVERERGRACWTRRDSEFTNS